MTHFLQNAKLYKDPEQLAADFLKVYFANSQIKYPLNPFMMLKDMGIYFTLKPFSKLEGVYIAAESNNDIAVVGINIDRPIARQRFTAAHELCHHLHDSERQRICEIGVKSDIERFADAFAAAVLMPKLELQRQVEIRKKGKYLDFDAVLDIAEFFGVSFEACVNRIAYKIHAIDPEIRGNTALKRAINKFSPKKQRAKKGYTDLPLYESLIDAYGDVLAFFPDEHTRLIFQNSYIYNDSRMEGVTVEHDQVAEIVTDLRLKQQNSIYCIDENEAFMSIAGHHAMYQDIFALPVKETCTVFDTIELNRKLFSCFPYPDINVFRQNDTLVLGAKFETVTFSNILPEMATLDTELQAFYSGRSHLSASEYIEGVVRFHHRLTVIHPFADGNGRTSRAFMNVMLIRASLTPVYILTSEKDEYVQALEHADLTRDYIPLYIFMFKVILRRNMEISQL